MSAGEVVVAVKLDYASFAEGRLVSEAVLDLSLCAATLAHWYPHNTLRNRIAFVNCLVAFVA